MNRVRPRSYKILFAAVVLATVTPLAFGQAGAPVAEPPRADAGPRQCQFLPGTAIPRLAMGVSRPGELSQRPVINQLELWNNPSPVPDDKPAAIRPLFVPFYVYAERGGGGTTWYLLGDAYAVQPGRAAKGGALGWADGRHLHLLETRYAYHFNNPKRVPPGVQLYQTRKDAYEAFDTQQRKGAKPDDASVFVAERLEEDAWDPLQSGAVPPFVELSEPPASGDDATQAEDLTDTTLTFPRIENRLLRIGAVCGGLVDDRKLADMEKEAQARAGIEIAFVIDETLSMEQWFPQVADFIEQNLAGEGDATRVKVAVSWYSDKHDPTDGVPPHKPGKLQEIVGPDIDADAVKALKQKIVKEVREHKERTVKGDFTAPELVYEGVRAAIKTAGFTPGENAMVFVVGDAGDRLQGVELAGVQRQVAGLVLEHNLQMAFVQVGDPNDPHPEFVEQAESLKGMLPADKQDAVVIEGVNKKKLATRIADIQARMEARREVLLREIGLLQSRNRYTKPGPAMQKVIEAEGLTVAEFDAENRQCFAPAYGWLYHPRQPDATPQLRELVFIARPEVDALIASLSDLEAEVRRNGKVNADVAVSKLAAVLAKNSGHSEVEAVLQAAWKAMPESDRSFGTFARDVLGLRVRNAILYHRGAAKPGAATARAADLLKQHKDRLFRSRERKPARSGLPEPVWHDSWDVMP